MIGIFDSGLGGLSVVKALTAKLPGYDIIYFGDTACAPYGDKSPETIIRYTLEGVGFLSGKGAKLIVLACNTASSIVTEKLFEKFDIPILELITPAVEDSIRFSKKMRIGIIGTRATINSRVYEEKIRKIRPEAKVYSAACPLLVPLAEEGWLRKSETTLIVKKYLLPLKVRQIDTLIMGCTHYSVLKELIQRKIGKRVRITDTSLTGALHVKNFLETRPDIEGQMKKEGSSRFFVSDMTDHFQKMAKTILRQNIVLEHVGI